MMLGILLSGQSDKTLRTFEKLGELLGVIFQLRDDQLTIYGNTDTVGKTAGNDISENKNTIYRVLLYERLSETDKTRAGNIFGNKTITEKEIGEIKHLFSVYNVDRDVQKIIEDLSKKADAYIKTLPLTKEKQHEFYELLTFIKTRTK
jgi:geranylgeranyl diphosphate synthase type I